MRVLFLGLKIFSATGGIEQVNKNWLFALNKLSEAGKLIVQALAMYDDSVDERYISAKKISTCKSNKWSFGLTALWKSISADVIIITHLNLSLFALLAKLINPKIKIIVQLHGIEAWANLSGVQERLLMQATTILAVSNYTQESVLMRYPALINKTQVLHNSLDPIKEYGILNAENSEYKGKLGIDGNKKLLITIGRLLSSEAYKGYDKTIEALAKLKDESLLFYIIGKYEQAEYTRINSLIVELNLVSQVKLIGYVSNDVLDTYYKAADLFVMPSKGEGFGLVFIDAMANGLRVLGGNADGSVDAISDFSDSYLVNPDNIDEIALTIDKALKQDWDMDKKIRLSDTCIKKFSATNFEKNIEHFILN
jgi:phosphatidylinositol alpha-1,6-mannosyltransferase